MSFILFCTILLLVGCSLGEEDTKNYSGIIGTEKALSYEYTVTKENYISTWVIRHKEEHTIIEETIENREDLQRFMYAVNDSHAGLSKLMIWITYLLIVMVISYYFYQKGRKNSKNYAVIIVVAISIAMYLVFNAFIELTTAYQSLKLHYFRLTN